MKLRILLVDDEPKVLKGLKKIIDRANQDWEVIGTLKNGLEALEFISKNYLDVVITDIKMPYMDGLELMKKANDIVGNLNFIVLSGYADFKYAQKAIRLKTIEYILKPPDYNDILSVLKKIEERKIKVEEKSKEEKELRDIHRKALITLKENKFCELMHMNNSVDIGSKLKDSKEFKCFYQKFALFVVKIDNFSFFKFDRIDEKITKLGLLRNGVQKSVYKRNGCLVDLYDGTYFCFINISNSNPVYLKEIANEIRSESLEDFEESITIGISRCYDIPEKINTAYKECLNILRNKVFFGKNTIIYIDEIKPDKGSQNYPLELEHKYVEYLRFGNSKKALSIMESVIAKIIDISGHDPIKFQSLVMEFIIVVSKSLSEAGATGISETIRKTQIFNKLSLLDNISDTKDLLYEYTKLIVNYFDKKNKPGCRKVISEIKLFIEKNYFNDISLRKIANEFFMNESYLSDLFKKETGSSFTNYLTSVRVEQAKVLLRQLDLKTYEISEMVGYKNSRYFNKVFKKYTGFTPFEYRERID